METKTCRHLVDTASAAFGRDLPPNMPIVMLSGQSETAEGTRTTTTTLQRAKLPSTMISKTLHSFAHQKPKLFEE
jgi:hypothetical protein